MLATFALLGVGAFLAAGTWAALAYPGGTHWDPHGVGFGWDTFFCDLLRPIARNGGDNATGSQAARFALFALAVGLGPFFALAREQLDLSPVRQGILLGGAYAGRVALILVAAGVGRLPAAVHDWAILLGGPLGLLSLGLLVVWARKLDLLLGRVGLLGLALAFWNLTQYVREALLGAPSWQGLPVVQKATVAGLLSFIVLFSIRARWR